MLLLGSIRSIMRICIYTDNSFSYNYLNVRKNVDGTFAPQLRMYNFHVTVVEESEKVKECA